MTPSAQGDGDPGPQPLVTISCEWGSTHLAPLTFGEPFRAAPLDTQLTFLTDMVMALAYAYIERLDRRRDHAQ
jgi:hypothetical protein